MAFRKFCLKSINKTSKIHLGPSPIEILQSTTIKSSEDQFKYLGDSLIYLSMVIKVIHESPPFFKKWNLMMSELATNKHLHQIAKLKELLTYLINEPYAENKWNPPSYIDENKELTQKRRFLSI